MPDAIEPSAGSDEPLITPAEAAPAAPADEPKEGTTAEEVAKVLHLPTNPKAQEAAKEEPKAEPKAEEPAPAKAEVKPAELEEVEAPEPAKPEPATPAAAAEREFSLEVTDAEGNVFTVSPGDNLEAALKDFVPKSNGQVLQILKDLGKLEDAKATYEADQAKAAEDSAHAERISTIKAGWEDEIKNLQADKRLPLTVKGEDNARVAEVFQFMTDENAKRATANRPLLASFEDALDKLENIEGRTAKVEAEKAERDTARKNGALVGGSSAPASNGSPVYKAGTARNANEAIRALGLLK